MNVEYVFSNIFSLVAFVTGWVMSQIWMSYVTHMNESCRVYAVLVAFVTRWVMSHAWMRCVRRLDESCHTCEWVMSHMWMRRVTHECVVSHGNATYEWVMSHMHQSHCIWTSHVPRGAQSDGPWVIHHVCLMSYVSRVMSHKPWVMRQTWLIRQTWLMRQTWLIRQTWLMRQTWLIRQTWLHVNECVTNLNESCHTRTRVISAYEWVVSHIWMSRVTPTHEPCLHVNEWC